MKSEIICSRCKQKCNDDIKDLMASWFGKYKGDKLTEVICRDCWDKGERWENSSLKK
jgi:hypothetical protein